VLRPIEPVDPKIAMRFMDIRMLLEGRHGRALVSSMRRNSPALHLGLYPNPRRGELCQILELWIGNASR